MCPVLPHLCPELSMGGKLHSRQQHLFHSEIILWEQLIRKMCLRIKADLYAGNYATVIK